MTRHFLGDTELFKFCRTDSFGSDLLPQSVPELLNCLPPEDDIVDMDEEE